MNEQSHSRSTGSPLVPLIRWMLILVISAGWLLCEEGQGASAETGALPSWLYPCDIKNFSSQTFILCPGQNVIQMLDDTQLKGSWSIPPNATGFVLAPNPKDPKLTTLFITCSDNETGKGHVYAFVEFDPSLKPGKFETWEAGFGARSPVLSPDGKRLYVCDHFEDTVTAYDTENGKKIYRVKTSRAPFSLDVTPDGKQLVVSHSLPRMAATAEVVACGISLLDAANGELVKEFLLPNGSIGVRDIRISPNGHYAATAHLLGRYTLPTTQVDHGWMNSNALTLIDPQKQEKLCTLLLDNVDSGAANPWAVQWSHDGTRLIVSHAGTHELSVIAFQKLLEKIQKLSSDQIENLPNDLSFLTGLRERVKLTGNGPRSLAVTEQAVYVAHYFSDSADKIELNGAKLKAKNIPLTKNDTAAANIQDPVHWGEQLFNDASICFQGWQSCASCHSSDARVDGLNWDLLNDGIGNPKNTKSLLLSHQTPPCMITGIRADAETAVRSGIRYILFTVRPEAEAQAMDAYLKSLKP
ncbi:MAG: YncE family protein, partial [Verrucomicrobia bacterium]|nr:YncE family protein [Verrucomicrobiota bacterium]